MVDNHRAMRGFSLLEALVVFLIIAVLAGGITGVATWVRCRAQEARAVNTATHLGNALFLYNVNNRTYPSAYPADLSNRLAPYLENSLEGYIDNPKGFLNFANPEKGSEPINKAYVSPPGSTDPGRYVLHVDPRGAARSAVLFGGNTVELTDRLPVQYGNSVLEPADIVTGGTITFATGSTVELKGATLARVIFSCRTGDGTVLHVIKLPRYRLGSITVNAAGTDIVQVATGAGVVSVRGGVADIDVVPVHSPASSPDPGDDPTFELRSITAAEPSGSGLGSLAILSWQRDGAGVTVNGCSVSGPIGSEGNVTLNNGATKGVAGGGMLTVVGGRVDGSVNFNGGLNPDTDCAGAEITGNLDCPGPLTLNHLTVDGAVATDGPVTLRNVNYVQGGLTANGGLVAGPGDQVSGNLSILGDMTLTSTGSGKRLVCPAFLGQVNCAGSVSGTGHFTPNVQNPQQTELTPATPQTYTPVPQPPATPLPSGSQPVDIRNILPNVHYGDLDYEGNATITFNPGRYYFRSIRLGGDAELVFNAAAGLVEVFVEHDLITYGTAHTRMGSGTAANVYFEVDGNVDIEGNDACKDGNHGWDGALYAPNPQSTVILGKANGKAVFSGSCYAAGPVTVNADVTYVPSARGIGNQPQDGSDSDDSDGNGGNTPSGPRPGDTCMETYVHIANHSAEVSADAKVIQTGEGVPWIDRRSVPDAAPAIRSLGRGACVLTGNWADVVGFSANP